MALRLLTRPANADANDALLVRFVIRRVLFQLVGGYVASRLGRIRRLTSLASVAKTFVLVTMGQLFAMQSTPLAGNLALIRIATATVIHAVAVWIFVMTDRSATMTTVTATMTTIPAPTNPSLVSLVSLGFLAFSASAACALPFWVVGRGELNMAGMLRWVFPQPLQLR